MKPCLLVIAGASGAGKTTLANLLIERYPERYVISRSTTTRAPRAGETNGVEYDFVTEEMFQGMVNHGDFIEHADVYGKLYGTPASHVLRSIKDGKTVVLVIDVQGHALIKQNPAVRKYLKSVFISLPLKTLEERLRNRKDMNEESIELRLTTAKMETARMIEFDRIVSNDRPIETVFGEFREVVEELLST